MPLPEGFILDEPERVGLPEGFVLDPIEEPKKPILQRVKKVITQPLTKPPKDKTTELMTQMLGVEKPPEDKFPAPIDPKEQERQLEAAFSKMTVRTKGIRERTGEIVFTEENAKKAIDRTNKQIEDYYSILECL